MPDLKLGDRVTVTDYLVRCRLSYREIAALHEQGMPVAESILKDVRKAIKREEERKSGPPSYEWQYHPHGGRDRKMWVPVSLHRSNRWDVFLDPKDGRLGWLQTDSRNNPVVTDLPLPLEGIVTRKLTLQDGNPIQEDYGSDWDSSHRYTGYQVTYSLHRRPVNVLPTMIKEAAQ